MRVAKVELADSEVRLAMVEEKAVRLLDLEQVENCRNLSELVQSPDPIGLTKFLVDRNTEPIPLNEVTFLAPMDRQEVWAAGVTYKRSQVARMEESKAGASHYDKVYSAPRPELFFKATPNRVSGPGQPLRIRKDSKWSVPEPELALVVTPDLRLAGFTIGNDMSARDIEGENPLYLPQAKFYKECCGLGPCILIPKKNHSIEPRRRFSCRFSAATVGVKNLSRRDRPQPDGPNFRGSHLVARSGQYFPEDRVILLTGTGIVPPDEFSLAAGDVATIEITGIGAA